MDDLLTRDLLQALDPVEFGASVGFTADPWQAEAMWPTRQPTIFNCSRQSGKSTCAAVIALWTAIYTPGALILLVSPSQRQSRELFAKVVDFLRERKPVEVLDEDNRLSLRLQNGSRIVSLPGDPKTVRGFSAPALVIEDEAAFVDDQLYTAIRPMLAVSGGRLILMSTPFGRRGHFFEAWQNGGAHWKRISVPAEECPRISADFLDQEKAALGEWRFSQEYQCQFVEGDDQVFSYALVKSAITDDLAPLFSAGELMTMGAL